MPNKIPTCDNSALVQKKKYTSTERSDTQLFGAGKSKGVELSGRLHAHLPQEDIEKKANLTALSQDAKKKFY